MVQFSCTNFGRCVKLLMKTEFVDPTGVFHWVDQRTIKGGVGGGGVFVNVMVGSKGHTLEARDTARDTLSRLLMIIPLCVLQQSTQCE